MSKQLVIRNHDSNRYLVRWSNRGLSLLLALVLLIATPVEAAEEWEYKSVVVTNLALSPISVLRFEEKINELGRKGWELVNVTSNRGMLIGFLKRKK